MNMRGSNMLRTRGRSDGQSVERLGKTACLALVLAGSVGIVSPSPAQQATTIPPSAAHDADQLQAVVVTAEKRAERIQDVPLSISAFTGDQLVAAGGASGEVWCYEPIPAFACECTVAVMDLEHSSRSM
jgi:outer membrane receptor protein involved in Fe transport